MARDLAEEEREAMAALMGAHRRRRVDAGTTMLRPAEPLHTRVEPCATLGWLPLAALTGATLVGAGCVVGGMALAPTLLAAAWPAGTPEWGVELGYTLAIFLPMLLLACGGAALCGVAPLAAGRRPALMLPLGLAIGVGGLAAAAGIAALTGGVQRGIGGGAALLLLGSAALLLQSSGEEVLLRGWLQPVLAARWRAWTAVAITALLFALLHVAGGARGGIELLNLALGGVMFGLLRWKSGGLIAPVAAHVGWNWLETMALGLDPNPGVGAYGALADLDLAGSPLWGGSAAGLNGSLAMTLVLVALNVPLMAWRAPD